MDVTEFNETCRDMWEQAQEHVAEAEPILTAPSSKGWLVFGISGSWDAGSSARLMRAGVIPLVKPERTAAAYRPMFQDLGITCGMLVAPAVVLDLGLGTHVEALIAVRYHPDVEGQGVWGVRVLEDRTCEPFPALDRVQLVPVGRDWMETLMS